MCSVCVCVRTQGHPGTQKLADRNRSLEFGQFLALCFRNPLAAIYLDSFLMIFLMIFFMIFSMKMLIFFLEILDFLYEKSQ